MRCCAVLCFIGYCQITCGRCDCCPTLTEAATQAGLTEFVWAMNRSTSNVESLSQPGLMATVMAPDDNAMRTLFGRLGELLSVLASCDRHSACVAHVLPAACCKMGQQWTAIFFGVLCAFSTVHAAAAALTDAHVTGRLLPAWLPWLLGHAVWGCQCH